MRNRRIQLLACAVLAAVACATPVTSALASAGPAGVTSQASRIPDGMSPHMFQRMMAQVPLDNAAARIRAAVARPGAGHDGFVQIRVDDDHHTLTVYWHGSVPADIQRLFTSLRRHVHLRVTPARYSTAELQQAVNQVLRERSGVRVAQVGPLPDGSGIQVTVAGRAPAVRGQSLFRLSVPVTLRSGAFPQGATCYWNGSQTVPSDTLAAPARCNDLYPGYWGGAVIINNLYGNGCSTGFGVHSTVDSHQYQLTASHCGNVGDAMFNGQKAQELGTIYLENHGHDDAAVITSAGNQYYDGPGIYNGDTHNTKLVAGEQPSSVGDWLCESGAYGGVMCGMQIQLLNQVWQYYDDDLGSNITVSNVAVTGLGSGGDNGGYLTPGDSGGPVFSLAGTAGYVTAKGINVAIDKATGQNAFMTIDWISSDFEVQVNTG